MPRKSNTSTVSEGDAASKDKDGMSIDDLSLPRTMIQRLAKGVLPPNTSIQKDALLAISKSATVFVNYLASHANEHTYGANKKTIQPSDVFQALEDIELPIFKERLMGELGVFSTTLNEKRNSYRRRIKEGKASAANTANNSMVDDSIVTNGTTANGHEKSDDSPPAAKKVRRSNGADPVRADGEEDGEGEGSEFETANEEEIADAEEDGEEKESGEDKDEGDGEGDGDGEERPDDQLVEDPIEERERTEVVDSEDEGESD